MTLSGYSSNKSFHLQLVRLPWIGQKTTTRTTKPRQLELLTWVQYQTWATLSFCLSFCAFESSEQLQKLLSRLARIFPMQSCSPLICHLQSWQTVPCTCWFTHPDHSYPFCHLLLFLILKSHIFNSIRRHMNPDATVSVWLPLHRHSLVHS